MRRFLRRHIASLLGLVLLAGLAYWVWDTLQPGPIQPGDRRWCQTILDKPIDTWTEEDARGFAEQNCMRWNLSPMPPEEAE